MSKPALPGKRCSTVFQVDPNKVILIGFDTEDGEEHPLYQERVKLPVPEEHIKTAAIHGIDDVVIVTKDLLVVAGRQRTKALRDANKLLEGQGLKPRLLTIKLIDGGSKADTKQMVGTMVRENALRVDPTPQENALLAQQMMDQHFFTLEETALTFGKTTQTIKDWIAVLNMSPEVKAAVKTGKISASKALTTFRKTPVDKQPERLAKVLEAAKTPKKRNMQKGVARFMAENPDTKLPQGFLLGLQFAFNQASYAECERNVKGFKSECRKARKALQGS